MDFHSMKRKELQSLCKKYSIPANLSNLAMAKKLSELLKEKEKPLIRGRSCLKGPDDNVNETESDVVGNKKVKKVRFSPDHELIEFTRFREVKGKRRRKSMLRDNSLSVEIVNNEKVVAENINIPGQVTRSRGQKLMDGVNKQRGRKLAKIDDVKDIIASIDVETEKACEKKIDRPDRVMRSRRRTLVDLLVNENNRGRNGVDNDVVLANFEREESIVVTRRALRNRDTVDGGVKENMKEDEEVLENTEIVEENVNLEPQIVLRRSKRNAKKVEDEGARKYENDRRRCSRKKHNELRVEASKFDADSATETEVEVKGKPEVEEVSCLEDPAKVQLRRSNRCKNTTDSHGEMGNGEPVAVNKDGYQMSTLIQTGTSTGVLKEDVKVAHLTGVTRRSRRRAVISQLVVETHKNLDDETVENCEPCLVEEGLGREENTRRSRRIASKREPATMMDELDGKANVPGKNEARKRKGVCVSGEHVFTTEDDPTEKPLLQFSQNAIGSEKATHKAFKGKIAQKRKQRSRVEKPNLVEASLEDKSKIAESFSVDAQLSMPQVVEISNDAALSCTGIAMNITSDARQTSGRKAYGKKRDASVEVSAGSFDIREVNGPKLENRENSSASENVILQIDNPEYDLEISESKSMGVEDKFHAPLEIAVENSSEDNILNTNKDGSSAALLFCQAEDFSCINTLGDREHTSDLNITGNSGFSRVISSTNGFSLVNESESTTKLEVMETNVAKSANKTVQQSLNVVEDEVDIVQDNLDRVELGVNELTLPIYSSPSYADHLAASNQRFEKDNEDTATKATEDDLLDPCGETRHKTYIRENKYAEGAGFSIKPVAETSLETNVSSTIHCSDHIEGYGNSMKARILEERKLLLSEDRLCADNDDAVIGEDTFLQEKQNSVEYAKIGEGELSKKYEFIEQPCHGDKSNTAIPWNNIIEDPGKFASAGTILGINYFSSSDQLDVPMEDIDAFGLEGASEQKKQPSGTMKEDQQEAYDMIEEDETFVQEENFSDLAEIVQDECFENHENDPQISISNLFDGEKSARTISQDADICDGEDSFKNADMLSKIADSPATAMFGCCTEINISASSSCSMEASLFRPNSVHHSLGNAGLESHNEKREDGTYSTNELCTESSVSIIQKDAVVGRSVDSDRKRHNIVDKLDSEKIDASVSKDTGGEEIVAVGSGEETWLERSNENGIEILHPINCSQQGPDAVDEEKSILLITPMKCRNANPVGELKSLLAKHVDAANIIREKNTLSIGSKTAGFAMSVHTSISKGDEGTHSQSNESSEDDENEPGLLVNLFSTPVGIENATQKKEAWSIGSKATRDTKSLDKTNIKGADESSNEDKNENPFNSSAINAYPSEGKHAYDPAEVVDVAISMDIACNKVEFERQFGLAMGSLDSEKNDSSVSKDITGKEFDTGVSGEESCLKQSIANRIETLHPISGAQRAPATTDEELKSPFATHVSDANTITENEALSTGSKTAGEALSLHSTISKGDYGILSQVNGSPEDDVNKTGLLINLFATPVGNANTIQKKEAWSTGSKSAGDTMSLEKTTSKEADESKKDKNENQLQNSFNLPANNAKTSEEKHDHDPAEIVDVAISMDIVCTKLEFESHFGLATESLDSEKIDVSVSEDIRGEEIDADGSGEESWSNQSNAPAATDEDLKSQFATHVGDAKTIRENEALSIGSKTAMATSVHSTISKGGYVILRQANESPEDDANEPGLVKSLVDNPVGVVNTTQEMEAWRIGSKAAGDTMSLDKTASKGEHEIFSQADESFSKDRNEIGDVAMLMDSACNKIGFESYSQMKSHKTEEEECRIQIEHAGNMVSYNEHEFNNLFDTPMDSPNCGPPNETFCHGSEIADLTMSADKFVSKMVSAEFFDMNFLETEGEKESKNEKTVQKCAVQQTPSQEVSATSSDVGLEEDQLKVLFATPVNSVTPCKENETFGRNASAAEQNANSEMAMEQSAVFLELNECSNNGDTQCISAEAKETHNTFQNADNIDADHGDESPMLSYLEMHLPLKENKEVGNSEADNSNFNLVHDHLKDSKKVEENSTTMLIKQQFEMPDHQSKDNVEFRSDRLAGSVLSVSGCHETLKESDVADTIKAYIDFESTASVGVDDPTHVVESIDNEHANLVELLAQSHLKPVNADEENDKHTIENKTRKVKEEMQLVESVRESREADTDPAIDEGYAANNALISRKKGDSIRWDNQRDGPGSGLKERSTAKNKRAILIHGTPNKAIMRGNMKENVPDSKRDNTGNLTTVRPAKRRALQDLQWK